MAFTPETARGVLPYTYESEEAAFEAAQDALGGLNPSTGYKLSRRLPRAHPRCPWLFVDRVGAFKGMGPTTETDSDPASLLEAPPIPSYAVYTDYRMMVEFGQRPYNVLADDSIDDTDYVQWYQEDGTLSAATRYANEWLRYTEWFHEPFTELITAQVAGGGGLKFRTNAGNPGGFDFPGGPSMRVSKRKIIARWYYVPYEYLTSENSYLAAFEGKINQTEWLGYPAGSLRFDGAKVVKTFTPPFPEFTMTIDGGVGFNLSQKVVVFDLHFEYVNRTQSNVPTPANANWIASGHNLMPWLAGDRKFYYATMAGATVDGDTSKWYPTYYSAPFQLLFTNPDAE